MPFVSRTTGESLLIPLSMRYSKSQSHFCSPVLECCNLPSLERTQLHNQTFRRRRKKRIKTAQKKKKTPICSKSMRTILSSISKAPEECICTNRRVVEYSTWSGSEIVNAFTRCISVIAVAYSLFFFIACCCSACFNSAMLVGRVRDLAYLRAWLTGMCRGL